jgi:MSHA pilin protein MshD
VRATTRPLRRGAGLTLVELLIFVIVVGIGIAGILVVYDRAVRGSADPLARKQALAIAESLLSEILAQPFTYCDPQDVANDPAAPPASTSACTGGAAGSEDKGGGSLGPQPPSEARPYLCRCMVASESFETSEPTPNGHPLVHL